MAPANRVTLVAWLVGCLVLVVVLSAGYWPQGGANQPSYDRRLEEVEWQSHKHGHRRKHRHQQRHKGGGGRREREGPVLLDNSKFLNRLIVVPERRLLFCYIDKVGCTFFNNLFRSLRSRYDPRQVQVDKLWFRNTNKIHHLTLPDLERILRDPTWHKAVFYRPPLVRFLSAFRSKCEDGHDDDGMGMCRAAFGKERPSFPEAALSMTTWDSQWGHRDNPHWARAGHFCGNLTRTIHLYDTVELLDPATSADKINALFMAIGVRARDVPLFVKTFPDSPHSHPKQLVIHHQQQQQQQQQPPRLVAARNEKKKEEEEEETKLNPSALLEQEPEHHKTDADAAVLKYYTDPSVICPVWRFFRDDYTLFKQPLEHWVTNVTDGRAYDDRTMSELCSLATGRGGGGGGEGEGEGGGGGGGGGGDGAKYLTLS